MQSMQSMQEHARTRPRVSRACERCRIKKAKVSYQSSGGIAHKIALAWNSFPGIGIWELTRVPPEIQLDTSFGMLEAVLVIKN